MTFRTRILSLAGSTPIKEVEEHDPVEGSIWLALSAANAVHADAKKRPLTDLEKSELHEAAELLEDAARD